jgi:hypothetical protein
MEEGSEASICEIIGKFFVYFDHIDLSLTMKWYVVVLYQFYSQYPVTTHTEGKCNFDNGKN